MTPRSEFPIDRAHFKAWLESLPNTAVVGQRADECNCPLAMYLNPPKKRRERSMTVDQREISVDDHRDDPVSSPVKFAMPHWAKKFVRLIDCGYRAGGPDVTVAEARTILERIP